MCFTEHSKPPEAVANDPKYARLPKKSRMDSGDILRNTSDLDTDVDTDNGENAPERASDMTKIMVHGNSIHVQELIIKHAFTYTGIQSHIIVIHNRCFFHHRTINLLTLHDCVQAVNGA